MSIVEQIDADLTSAMKERNELKLSTLRLVRSAMKNKQIDVGRPLTDEEAQAVLKTMKKQFADALQDFENARREDLIERQKAELALIEGYLPSSCSPDELERLVKEAVEATGATGPADFGKAMGAAVKAVAGRAEGAEVRAVVQKLLAPG
ncbi:GatB/YqeY domain-containing protein [Patescibacteria group bacterium]|uniref:GatB/YqeY domain-containing protein n=1 Tax=candidate division WWE3 bacterium TaxID=2053526 RepID=A0A928TQJ6_UNCKA|nr:GatB/YqeY domain-containing protein [candidate division WWE3 bacterium]MCL4732392.1 GatB/YqeY domain-containing protein [Patescibacteria group bacterium]MDL1952818.1 GatB/YqeY domain-containing protein [Candidatus Uhrbacteria bacterium UHB]RIL01054.1 MAG: aspartyl-tRNA amidotransferase [Candidatus Uhrbacteria bacterium]